MANYDPAAEVAADVANEAPPAPDPNAQALKEAGIPPGTQYLYHSGGYTFGSDKPLSADELAHIVGQLPPEPEHGIFQEFGNAAAREMVSAGQGVGNAVRGLGLGGGDPKTASMIYNKYMAEHAPAVPSISDIKSGHDVALYIANLLGSASPYVAAALLGARTGTGMLPAAILGAAAGGGAESERPGSTLGSDLTAAGLGALFGGTRGAVMTAPAASLLKKITRGAAGNALLGAAQGATSNIPQAVSSGEPVEAMPDVGTIGEGALQGALAGGILGGAHGIAERVPGAVARAIQGQDPETARANGNLAQRIANEAQASNLDLNRVNYDDPRGAKVVLDNVHNQLAEDIKGVANVLKPMLDPAQAKAIDDLLERTQAQSALRDARNKVKGSVSDDDLAQIHDMVGHTQEGQLLLDLLRQSNALSDLYRGGLKGGISKYTDWFNPFPNASSMGSLPGLIGAYRPALAIGSMWAHPLLPFIAGGITAAGRGIDALTGRRSTVQRFVNQNLANAAPNPYQGLPSVLFHKQMLDEAYRMNQEFDKREAFRRAQYNEALNQAYAQERDRQLKAQAAQQAYLNQREQQFRLFNRLANDPGQNGFDRYVYNQTGVRPADAVPGMLELFRRGAITHNEFHSFFYNPRDLMKGNIGNHVVDLLARLADSGTIARDPAWQGPVVPNQGPGSGSSGGPQAQIFNPLAYAAQAAGNQARVTAAQSRVAASNADPVVKQAINDAIAAIGRTTSRAEAMGIRENLINSLRDPLAKVLARQETHPLVAQIRHP